MFVGLYGDTEMEQAKCDMIVGCCDDLFHVLMKVYLADGEDARVRTRILTYRPSNIDRSRLILIVVNFQTNVSTRQSFNVACLASKKIF